MEMYFSNIASLVKEHGFWLVFIFLMLESVPLIGLAVPGVTVVIFVGYLSTVEPSLSSFAMFIAALSGILVGDNAAYFVARIFGQKSRRLRAFVERNPKAVEVVSREPLWILVFFQFPVYLRMVLPATMGAIQEPTSRWLSMSILGTVLFVSVFFSLGAGMGLAQRELEGTVAISGYIQLGFAIVFAAWLGSVIYRAVKAARSRSGL